MARSPTFGFGQFFGTPEIRHELSGFSLARIAATRPPMEVPDHTHDSAHLVLVVEGHYLTGATPLEPGRSPVVVYNPPGTTHADRFGENQGIFFTLSISDRSLDSLRGEAIPTRPLAIASGPAVRLIRRLSRLCASWPARSRVRVEQICFDVLMSLANDAARSRPSPPRWLVSVRDALAGRWCDAPPLQDLADGAGVHPVHLIRSFRRFFGVTPGEFLRERRLSAARQLLIETDLPIADIALSTGFADQSHFTKAFRRAHPVPPAAFRRRQRATLRNPG